MRLEPEQIAGATGFVRSVELTYAVLRGYGLDEPDLTDAVRLLRSTFHGFISLEAVEGFSHPRAVEASWRSAVAALHVLLQHWPRSGTP